MKLNTEELAKFIAEVNNMAEKFRQLNLTYEGSVLEVLVYNIENGEVEI